MRLKQHFLFSLICRQYRYQVKMNNFSKISCPWIKVDCHVNSVLSTNSLSSFKQATTTFYLVQSWYIQYRIFVHFPGSKFILIYKLSLVKYRFCMKWSFAVLWNCINCPSCNFLKVREHNILLFCNLMSKWFIWGYFYIVSV